VRTHDKTGFGKVKVPYLNRSNTYKKTERLSSALKVVVEGGLVPRPKADKTGREAGRTSVGESPIVEQQQYL